MYQPDTLDEQQRPLVDQLRAAHPDLETAYRLSQAFVAMLAECRAWDLDDCSSRRNRATFVSSKALPKAFAGITLQ